MHEAEKPRFRKILFLSINSRVKRNAMYIFMFGGRLQFSCEEIEKWQVQSVRLTCRNLFIKINNFVLSKHFETSCPYIKIHMRVR